MRPNHRFLTLPVEDRTVAREDGTYGIRPADFAFLSQPGDNRTELEKEVTAEEIAYWHRMPHLNHLPDLYERWRQGMTAPVSGTPLKDWEHITPDQLHKAMTLNVRTVENLADLNDEGCRTFGMGAISLRTKAKNWLNGDGSPQGKAMAAMRAEVEAMKAQLAAKAEPEKAADLESLTKAQLAEAAAGKGLDLNPDRMNKAEMIEALTA